MMCMAIKNQNQFQFFILNNLDDADADDDDDDNKMTICCIELISRNGSPGEHVVLLCISRLPRACPLHRQPG